LIYSFIEHSNYEFVTRQKNLALLSLTRVLHATTLCQSLIQEFYLYDLLNIFNFLHQIMW